jgi:hypothetical protein
MPLGNPTGGFSYSPEFQSSALPWVTSSVASAASQVINFSYITRFLTFSNLSSNSLFVGFTANGISGSSPGQNYATVPGNQTVTYELRVATVYVAGNGAFSLTAGLTTVPAGQMPILSGSGPTLGGTLGANWAGVG